jgi:uncharacterized protein
MSKFVRINLEDVKPTEEIPAQENVLEGNPRFRTWTIETTDGNITAGIWETTSGKFRFLNPFWEYCRILTGESIITEDGGEPRKVKAGDSFVLKAGFQGTWECLETTRKDFVARD